MFHSLYLQLHSKVMEEDYDIQMKYLTIIADTRQIPVEYLLSRGCIFIPNNDYIRYHLGAAASEGAGGFYLHERCLWTHFLLIPVTDLAGNICGITGWDVENKYKQSQGETGLQMYKVSSSEVFDRSKYFLTDVNLLKELFSKRVIFVVDGVFDSMNLNRLGVPAISALGSYVSQSLLYFLRWFKFVYVVHDNDPAGMALTKRLQRSLPSVFPVSQTLCKDIDEFIRTSKEHEEAAKQFFSNLVEHPVAAPQMLTLPSKQVDEPKLAKVSFKPRSLTSKIER